MLLTLYSTLTRHADLPLKLLLKKRLAHGKEDEGRWQEKTAIITKARPHGSLIWLHAASVGEAQSAMILIDKILSEQNSLNILVTSGTLSSAQMLEKRLPDRAFHQFLPLDHPEWVKTFINYWKPDLVLWLESELWPNILLELKTQNIPAILLNARLSPSSLKKWKLFANSAREILSAFSLILCQTEQDAVSYRYLGAINVEYSGNLKYSAADLPCNQADLDEVRKILKDRKIWLYASTHASEELLAAHLHQKLKKDIPSLLTIIVPRHPERGKDILPELQKLPMQTDRRSNEHALPDIATDLYLADTLGELGLFYRLSPIAVIGRSFSDDGGGGHNPIEAAQLNCAVLHGPNIQNLQKIYDDMAAAYACIPLKDKEDFYKVLHRLLSDDVALKQAQDNALKFCKAQENILENVLKKLVPFLQKLKGQRTV